MSLPIRPLPIVERWDCHNCGDCCKRHTVFLDADDLKRIESQHWASHPDFRNVPVVVKSGMFGSPILNQRADGSCIFLDEGGLCRVHAEFGEPAKPWACRMYPFELIPFDRQVRLTIRRNCPSAAGNRGRPVSEHLNAVREFVDKALPANRQAGPPPIVASGVRSWKAASLIVDAVQRKMTDADLPLVRRFMQTLLALSALERTAEARRADDSLKKLVPALMDAAAEEVGAVFANRSPASPRGNMLFRQTAAEYARFHPNVGDRPGFFERLRLLKAAWTIARGKGDLPPIHPGLPTGKFEQLDRPLGLIGPVVYKPIADFFETHVAAVRYCGAGHFGWSIVDGFRALALAYACSLWLLRWVSLQQEPTAEAAIETIRMIDRSHDYPLLAGRRHRTRVTWLARNGDLERLIAWQAR